jgi:hypothetical protein
VAEPLFAMMFGPEFVSESPDEPTAPWGAYVAAAARAVTDHSEPTAIGGGPPTPDRRDLDVVTKGVSREMIALAERLPSGQLRDAVERTARELATFDVDEVVAGR